jgi:hypothetical protein
VPEDERTEKQNERVMLLMVLEDWVAAKCIESGLREGHKSSPPFYHGKYKLHRRYILYFGHELYIYHQRIHNI